MDGIKRSHPDGIYPQQEIIRALLEKKADVNAHHLMNGMTALHIACARGDDLQLIKLLLQAGSLFYPDYAGREPLDLLDLSYEDTQQLIRDLTTTTNDRRDAIRDKNSYYAFGGRSYVKQYANNQSQTATLPLPVERAASQAKIRELLAAPKVDPCTEELRRLEVLADYAIPLISSTPPAPVARVSTSNLWQALDTKKTAAVGGNVGNVRPGNSFGKIA